MSYDPYNRRATVGSACEQRALEYISRALLNFNVYSSKTLKGWSTKFDSENGDIFIETNKRLIKIDVKNDVGLRYSVKEKKHVDFGCFISANSANAFIGDGYVLCNLKNDTMIFVPADFIKSHMNQIKDSGNLQRAGDIYREHNIVIDNNRGENGQEDWGHRFLKKDLTEAQELDSWLKTLK